RVRLPAAAVARAVGRAGEPGRRRSLARSGEPDWARHPRENVGSGGGMFFDVNPRTARPTSVKAAVCFYPYGTDLADARHVAGLERHLFEPAEFWTAYPVPSSSVDDPLFNPDAEWKGKRHNCPWNGRVWPMTNSHIIDALARVVRLHQGSWAGKLGHLIHQFARMMTFDGDPERPNC